MNIKGAKEAWDRGYTNPGYRTLQSVGILAGLAALTIAGLAIYAGATHTNFMDTLKSTLKSRTFQLMGAAVGGALAYRTINLPNFLGIWEKYKERKILAAQQNEYANTQLGHDQSVVVPRQMPMNGRAEEPQSGAPSADPDASETQ